MLALAAYTFTSLMMTEDEASRLIARQVQSKYLVDSGVDYCRLFLATDQRTLREKGGIWDNATSFQAVPVGVDPSNPNYVGRFSVICSSLDDEGNPEGYRFGLTDESAKLNLNTLTFADNWSPGGGRQLLMGLPDMTEEIADSILDYIDSDTEAREYGVESSYYESLAPPYSAKDGPLDSVDELLNVRGVTPQLMFGLDSNRNGLIDNEEMAAGRLLRRRSELVQPLRGQLV
jgi:hypothetical protein